MHELSIAQNILGAVQKERETNQWGAVKTIALQIGVLAGVHSDSLVFGFEVLRSEFNMPDCELAIELVPLTLSCAACNAESLTEELSFRCPVCSSSDVTVVKGYELDIVSVDVADQPSPSPSIQT